MAPPQVLRSQAVGRLEPAEVTPDELLSRLSATLKADIAPAVTDEYTRTQTHMASVILERLSKQVKLSPVHETAEAADLAQLIRELEELLTPKTESNVDAAWQRVSTTPSIDRLGPLLRALHEWHDPVAEQALARIRPVLRADIDRRMEIAS